MPGFDDPRYLQQVITQLQQKVKKLEKDTLPLLSHQRGPTPGWLNAGQIGPGPGMKSAMHLHMDGTQAGVAPRQTVTDAAGTVRVELGNLAANGVSPAQYGLRANDASGNPIFDSLGLISVMQQLGRGDSSGTQNFTTTTPTLYTGVTTTFSLVRAIRVLVLCEMLAFATAQTGEADLFVDGVDISTIAAAGALVWGISGPTVTSMTFYSATLAAGSHTIQLRGFVSAAGGTLNGVAASLVAYSLGT